jgi:hypothetical protein
MEAWLESKLFRASFLDAEEIRRKVLHECSNGGEFLMIVMGEMARAQGVERWADNSPEELLYTLDLKKYLPDALFIHMIRDGRDVSLSLDARPFAWIRPFSWDMNEKLAVTAIFWEWIVKKGRRLGQRLGGDYIEIHFEQLQADPCGTLAWIGEFIRHDLDYDRIRRVGIGSVSEPNTSFKGDQGGPVGRWKRNFTPEKLALVEALVGPTLRELKYPLATVDENASRIKMLRLRWFYRAYFAAKFWFKNSPLGRAYLGPLTGPGIDNIAIGVDPAREPVNASRKISL